jgi:hypothetical protein
MVVQQRSTINLFSNMNTICVSDSKTENSPALELLQSNHRSKYREYVPYLSHAKRYGNRRLSHRASYQTTVAHTKFTCNYLSWDIFAGGSVSLIIGVCITYDRFYHQSQPLFFNVNITSYYTLHVSAYMQAIIRCCKHKKKLCSV